MPKLCVDDDIVVRRNKRPIIKRVLMGILVFIVLLIVVFSASFVSNIITVGNFSLTLFNNNIISIARTDMYAISFGNYDNSKDAQKNAIIIQAQGGAGYVWNTNSKFYVLGAIYKSMADAQKVQLNLAGKNTEIIQIALPQIIINSKDFLNEQKETIKNAINIFRTTILSIYDNSIMLDTGETSYVGVASNVNLLKSEVCNCKDKINDLMAQYNNSQLIVIREYLTKTELILDKIVVLALNNDKIISGIKYSLFEIIKINIDLTQNL